MSAKSNGMSFKVKKGDNSVIQDIALFYNIANLIEGLLNIANLRCSLSYRVLILYTRKEKDSRTVFFRNEISLDALLDEIALTYESYRIKGGYLSFLVNFNFECSNTTV